jgi:hypothetical protein
MPCWPTVARLPSSCVHPLLITLVNKFQTRPHKSHMLVSTAGVRIRGGYWVAIRTSILEIAYVLLCDRSEYSMPVPFLPLWAVR